MNETPSRQDEQILSPEQTIVSRSGTRHIIGIGPQFSKLHAGRISTLCGFGLWPEEGPFEAIRDCVFCEHEAAAAKRKAEVAAEADRVAEYRTKAGVLCSDRGALEDESDLRDIEEGNL